MKWKMYEIFYWTGGNRALHFDPVKNPRIHAWDSQLSHTSTFLQKFYKYECNNLKNSKNDVPALLNIKIKFPTRNEENSLFFCCRGKFEWRKIKNYILLLIILYWSTENFFN
jgi:hypothetical protein